MSGCAWWCAIERECSMKLLAKGLGEILDVLQQGVTLREHVRPTPEE